MTSVKRQIYPSRVVAGRFVVNKKNQGENNKYQTFLFSSAA